MLAAEKMLPKNDANHGGEGWPESAPIQSTKRRHMFANSAGFHLQGKNQRKETPYRFLKENIRKTIGKHIWFAPNRNQTHGIVSKYGTMELSRAIIQNGFEYGLHTRQHHASNASPAWVHGWKNRKSSRAQSESKEINSNGGTLGFQTR
jgi:hypothetical protein